MPEISETFCPASRQEWRQWLTENHDSSPFIWLIYHKKNTGTPSIAYSEAVDEALCFGWIDGVRKSIDDRQFIQYFTKRKPRSVWSKVNKGKIEQLIAEGLMTPAGLKCIEIAKTNGSWGTLDEAETGIIPDDLQAALTAHAGAQKYFTGLSKSARKAILQWLTMAKRPETREKRIQEIASLASQGLKPKQFR